MNGVEFYVIKKRGEGYVAGYSGAECSVSGSDSMSGYYLVSAKDAAQRLQDYCDGGELPIFTLEVNTHAVPFPNTIKRRSYQELVDNDCKIGYVIFCFKEDSTEIQRRESDKRLFIDYTEKAENYLGKKDIPLYGGVVYTCASSSDGKEIILEEEMFGLLCNVYKRMKKELGYSTAYLQVGACKSYENMVLDVDIINTYLRIEGLDKKKYFVQELQKEINLQIMQSGQDRLRYIIWWEEDSLKKMIDSLSECNASKAPRIITMVQQCVSTSRVGKVGIGVCGCSFIVMLAVSVKSGIDMMVQHESGTNDVVFGVVCGLCVLLGLILCVMIAMKCKFSHPRLEIEITDMVDFSARNLGCEID